MIEPREGASSYEFSSLLVSGGFRGGFLVSSLPVCDGGMLEFLLVFLVVFSRKAAVRIVTRSHKPVRTLSVFSVISPSFRSETMSAL